MIERFYVRPLYVYRSGSVTKNAYNDYEKNWSSPVLVTQVFGWIGPETGQQEVVQDQEKFKGSLLAFLPPDTDVKYDDLIVADGPFGQGKTYQVLGNPALGYTPTGVHHIEVHVTAIGG